MIQISNTSAKKLIRYLNDAAELYEAKTEHCYRSRAAFLRRSAKDLKKRLDKNINYEKDNVQRQVWSDTSRIRW